MRRTRVRRAVLAAALGATALEAAALRHYGYGLGGRVTVRCRQGHTFATTWIPGASITSVRLGWWRFQRCPVGEHWSLVTPVRRS